MCNWCWEIILHRTTSCKRWKKKLADPDAGNPFIDPTGQDWQNYLAWVEAEFRQFMEDGR